MKDGGVLKA